jgi:hypothetical protein
MMLGPVSMWLLFGLYGNQQLEMGMCYSRLIRANGFFVKQIQVHNLKERGPSMYSFSTRPGLDSPVSDEQEMEDVVVDPRWQKRFTYWLNKGSYLELSCCLKDSGSGTDSLIVAIVKGAISYHQLFYNQVAIAIIDTFPVSVRRIW